MEVTRFSGEAVGLSSTQWTFKHSRQYNATTSQSSFPEKILKRYNTHVKWRWGHFKKVK